ncbi:hypothetical protein BA896_010620 [Janthinobacterium lividum]|uniref:Uncharacterized protein n=1 Tax=Janthinobacterium lividum TaxID=29581 RepID=A0A1E8PSG0_9BURK|nr:hypothetical protein BA896_010620 [Janthinobacterium lividum]
MMAGAGAFLQGVRRAAIRALGDTVMVKLQKHARMRRPQRHGRVRAVGWQVFTVEFDRWLGGFCHLVMLREAIWKEVGCCKKYDFNGFRQTAKIMAKMAA